MSENHEESDKEFKGIVAKESEVGCFLAMQSLSYMSWRLNHDAADGRIKDGPHIDEQLDMFGRYMEIVSRRVAEITGMKVLDGDKTTSEYHTWYCNWEKFMNSLPEEESKLIAKRVNDGEDTTDVKLVIV
jgi:hypothetical protein